VSAEFFLFDVLVPSHWDRHTRYDSVLLEKRAVSLNVLVGRQRGDYRLKALAVCSQIG
jgi:hypothetical protein